MCGETASGLRLKRYQRVICQQCGESLFVLPINVYPEPPPPPPEQPEDVDGDPRAREPDIEGALLDQAEADAAKDHDLLNELAAESRHETRKDKPTAKRRKKKAKAAKPKAVPAEEPEATPEPAPAQPALVLRVPLRQRLRRFFSPFRITVVTIVGVVVATVAWQVHSRNVENARVEFDAARKKALTLLEERDFAGAEPLLDQARRAADLTGRRDGLANRVRRLYLETNAINNLAQTSLFEALSTATAGARTDAPAVLMSQLEERWIVLDTHVAPAGRVEDENLFTVDLPLQINGVLVEARVVGSEFDGLRLPREGSQVIFAAQIAACALEGGQPDTLVLQLAPESVRLWTDADLYDAIGMSGLEDSAALEVLQRQAEHLGVEP